MSVLNFKHLRQVVKQKKTRGVFLSPSPFLEQVRKVIRLRHLSLSTEDSYLYYIKNFILFHQKRHPNDMGVPKIRAYLSHLAIEGNVSTSIQRVAFSALLFLYRDVLKTDLPEIDGIERARASNFIASTDVGCYSERQQTASLWTVTHAQLQ